MKPISITGTLLLGLALSLPAFAADDAKPAAAIADQQSATRSEERRVGKECA